MAVTKNKHLKIVTSLLKRGGQKSFFHSRKNHHMFVYILSFYLHNDTAQKSSYYNLHSASEQTVREVIICSR